MRLFFQMFGLFGLAIMIEELWTIAALSLSLDKQIAARG